MAQAVPVQVRTWAPKAKPILSSIVLKAPLVGAFLCLFVCQVSSGATLAYALCVFYGRKYLMRVATSPVDAV